METALESNLLYLDEISKLEDNWDGYGAEAFSSKHIALAKDIVTRLPYQPEIFPTPRSIQFEYTLDNNDYLEFELFEDGYIVGFIIARYYKDYQDTRSSHYDMFTNITVDQVIERVREFYEG